jgi:hypothetical protein
MQDGQLGELRVEARSFSEVTDHVAVAVGHDGEVETQRVRSDRAGLNAVGAGDLVPGLSFLAGLEVFFFGQGNAGEGVGIEAVGHNRGALLGQRAAENKSSGKNGSQNQQRQRPMQTGHYQSPEVKFGNRSGCRDCRNRCSPRPVAVLTGDTHGAAARKLVSLNNTGFILHQRGERRGRAKLRRRILHGFQL